jgi:uncharacterized membrane protein
MTRAAPRRRSDWLIPAGLIALGFVPGLVGLLRLVQLGGGAQAVPGPARFFASPWPISLHLVASLAYVVLGAFQFSPGWRGRHLAWHRAAGRGLVACGLVSALSALWMTQFYPVGTEPPASFDGALLYAIRVVVGVAMVLFLGFGLAAAIRRRIPAHRAWMMRAYALGLGAGTQVFTHLPWFLFPAIQGETTRAVLMGAGWALNLAVAEWLVSRGRPTGSAHAPRPAVPR